MLLLVLRCTDRYHVQKLSKSYGRQSLEVIEIIEQERCCSHHFHKAIRKLALMIQDKSSCYLPPMWQAGLCVVGWLKCKDCAKIVIFIVLHLFCFLWMVMLC